jgi:biofilm PGA synthesis N-glycosyltransferase PgaC
MDQNTYNTFRDIAVLIANLMLFKYFMFLILAPFHKILENNRRIKLLRRQIKEETKKYNPLISVIIPAWNEEKGIIKTIRSVMNNDYNNVEVVVVSDGSTDMTNALVEEFIFKHFDENNHYILDDIPTNKRIKFIKKDNGGKGTALNEGIINSQGEIIVTVDGDSFIHKNALKNLIKYYEDPTISGVVGNVKVANSKSIIGLTQKLEYLFGFYFKRAHAVMGAEYIFGGACATFRRSVFDEIGLYDTKNKTEDIELTMRFRFAGYNCTYAPDVVCYTEGASTISGLVNQRLRWKKGRMDTFIKYRGLFFSLDKKHNKFLSFFILPYALIQEFQLLLEPIFIALLVGYSFITLDLISLSFGILFLFVVYLVNAFFASEDKDPKLILLFLATWPLFYFLLWVEFLALIRSLYLIYKGNDITWQKWNRQGI